MRFAAAIINLLFFILKKLLSPLGHSTSGSHERYKSEERLKWEEEFDPIRKMSEWIINEGIATAEELDKMSAEAEEEAKESRKKGWEMFQNPIKIERDALVKIINDRTCRCVEEIKEAAVDDITEDLKKVLASYQEG